MFTGVSNTDLAGGGGGSRRCSGIGSATITDLAGVDEFNSGAPVATRVDLPFATGSSLPPRLGSLHLSGR